MSIKTCGDCIFYHPIHTDNGVCTLVEEFANTCDFVYACKNYLPKQKPTNGDKIIAGGMRAIAEFALHHCCNNCIYFDGNNPYRSTCGKPDNKTCEDGVEAWLNAPVESEMYNETTSN